MDDELRRKVLTNIHNRINEFDYIAEEFILRKLEEEFEIRSKGDKTVLTNSREQEIRSEYKGIVDKVKDYLWLFKNDKGLVVHAFQKEIDILEKKEVNNYV